jgi:hypothetical protein
MKEEELMKKYGSHINSYIYESKHNETTNHKHQCDNGVRQSRLCLRAFVSVGEYFLFMFEALNVHHNSAQNVTK